MSVLHESHLWNTKSITPLAILPISWDNYSNDNRYR